MRKVDLWGASREEKVTRLQQMKHFCWELCKLFENKKNYKKIYHFFMNFYATILILII